MDEATSSLDTLTERRLLQVASEAFANRTVITIAVWNISSYFIMFVFAIKYLAQ